LSRTKSEHLLSRSLAEKVTGFLRGTSVRLAKNLLFGLLGSVLALVTLFYAFTGIVREEGAFGYVLVVKPRPSAEVLFGGGEEGAWRRGHPDAPTPWWQKSNLNVLARGDWETDSFGWDALYDNGFFMTAIAWFAYAGAITLSIRASRRRQSSRRPVDN
jgi:hypothetical protein